MSAATLAALLVVCAALLSAAYNTIMKVGDDRLVVGAMAGAAAGICGLLALPFVTPPPPAAWPCLALSILAQTAYYPLIVTAYREGDLSLVYPLMRGSSLAVINAFAILVAGEPLGPNKIAGLGVILFGMVLAVDPQAWTRPAARRPAMFAAATGLMAAAYVLADGTGARRSPDPFGYIAWMFALSAMPIALIVLTLRRRAIGGAWRRNWRHGLSSGTVATAAYAAVVFALSFGSFASIAALRELTTVFTAIIARFVLGESLTWRRVLAVGLIVLGALLINA